jgi:hypothetical protein
LFRIQATPTDQCDILDLTTLGPESPLTFIQLIEIIKYEQKLILWMSTLVTSIDDTTPVFIRAALRDFEVPPMAVIIGL